MATTVTGNLRDIGRAPHLRQVKFQAPLARGSEVGELITREPVFARPDGLGNVSVSLEPGLCDVTIGQDTFRVVVPESSPADLWEMIEETGGLPAGVPAGSIAAAVEAWMGSNGDSLRGADGAPGSPGVSGPRGEGLRIDGQVSAYEDLPASTPDGEVWLAGGKLFLRDHGAWPDEEDGVQLGGAAWLAITGRPETFPPSSHTHPVAQISDSTTVGRSVLTAADAAAARTAIGAVSTDDPRLSSGGGGPHTHTASQISDSTTVGRSVLTAIDAAAARSAISAAVSGHVHSVGDLSATGSASSSTFLRGDGVWAAPAATSVTASQISDSTTVGRAVLTAVDAGAARTAIGAGTSSLALGATGTTAAAGNHTHTAAGIAGIPWAPELVLTNSALAASYQGYGDGIGGIQVEPGNSTGVQLRAVSIRLAEPATVLGGTGGCTIDIYRGTTTSMGSSIASFTIPAASNGTIHTLAPGVDCAANSILRARITTGSSTTPGVLQLQYRGVYL